MTSPIKWKSIESPRRLWFGTEVMFLGFALLLTAVIYTGRSVTWINQRQETLKSETVQGFVRGGKAPNNLWLFGEDAVVVIVVKDQVHVPHVQRLFPEAQVRLIREVAEGNL